MKNSMKIITAGQISLRNDSPVWFLLRDKRDNLPVLVKDSFDAEVLDVYWLLDDLKNLEEAPAEERDEFRDKHALFSTLAGALDREKVCKGWRKLHLLYIYP